MNQTQVVVVVADGANAQNSSMNELKAGTQSCLKREQHDEK